MRPPNDERVIVEYIRVHRIMDPGLFAQDVEPFGGDFAARLQAALDFVGHWRRREWRLGNIEVRPTDSAEPAQVIGQLGWTAEVQSADAPPLYDEQAHRWPDEPAQVRAGELGLFALDVGSQVAAVTSLAGDLSIVGFCRALTDLLEQAELTAANEGEGFRPKRTWLAESIDERGTFETWVSDMAKVTQVSATFHLPNPRTTDELQPVVDMLTELKATSGGLTAKSADGLDPFGHPLMRGAVAMQENDYGSITGQGQKADGQPDSYSSREHPVRDVLPSDPDDPTLSVPGIATVLLRALLKRLEEGLR